MADGGVEPVVIDPTMTAPWVDAAAPHLPVAGALPNEAVGIRSGAFAAERLPPKLHPVPTRPVFGKDAAVTLDAWPGARAY